MKVLVTGATGTLGRPLCSHLLKERHAVAILTRNGDSARESVHARVQILEWDPGGENVWADKCGQVDAVINLAGAPIAGRRWSTAYKKLILDSRITATRAIVGAIREKKITPRTLINASATGFYGGHPEKVMTEESGGGSDFLSQVCRQWEAAAVKAEECGVRVVRIRTGIVLSREGGALAQLLPVFRRFLGGTLGDGSHWMPWIHIEDVVRSLAFILDNRNIDGPVNCAAPNPVTNNQFVQVLGETLGKPAVFRIPRFAIWLRYGELADSLFVSQKVSPGRLLDAGYSFHFPEIEQALENLLAPDRGATSP